MTWEGSTRHRSLRRGEVHVWCTLLADLDPHLNLLSEGLSSFERLRATRLIDEKARIDFCLSHGFLRAVLGLYLDSTACSSTLFVDGPGRPVLSRPGPSATALDFNLSRTSEVAVCAIGRGHSIGIDVEKMDPLTDLDGLTESIFTPRERAAFALLPMSQRERAFYLLWVSKEAVLKSEGSGLRTNLRAIEVGPKCWTEAVFCVQLATRGYFVRTFDFANNYIAALATQSIPEDVRFLNYKVPAQLCQ